MLMNNDFITDNLILDFHDNFSYTLVDLNEKLLENIFNRVNTFNFKSLYHKVSFIEFLNGHFSYRTRILFAANS